MARKQKRYQKPYSKRQPESQKVEQPAIEDEPKAEEVYSTPEVQGWIPYLVIFLIGFALYANTINFGYTLDDKLYITENDFTKKGFDGIKDHWTNDLMTGFFGKEKNLVEGGRYRPLPLTTHAIEWQIFGKNATVSHFVNVIMYGLIGVLLLSILNLMFRPKSDKWWWTLPFIATALWLAHPLHTEVGANIKSRDELMGIIFAFLAMRSVLLYAHRDEQKQLWLTGLWFFLSLTCRESSLIFLGVIPLTLIFFTKIDWKKGALSLVPMLAALLVYMAIRIAVYDDLGKSMDVARELMNKPYMYASTSERYASILFTMGLYVKLLFWPHPLTHDYYPFHPFKTYEEVAAGSQYADWSEPMSMFAVIAYLALAIYGLRALIRKLQDRGTDVIGYGILIYLGTFILFSNLLFEIGSFMNERWMFIPSLGFCLAIAWLLHEKLSKKAGMTVALALTAVIFTGYFGKTFMRNYAWRNDTTLSAADVDTSDGSAKVKMTRGSELVKQAQSEIDPQRKAELLNRAEQLCLQSLTIHPNYFPPNDILGIVYFEKEDFDRSVYYFQQAVLKKGGNIDLVKKLEAAGTKAAQNGRYESAIAALNLAANRFRGSDRSRVYSQLGEVYGKDLNQPNEAMKYLRKAKQADPNNAGAYQKIGIIQAMQNQPDSAMINFQKALQLDPENARVMLNIGILYNQLGNTTEGNRYMTKAMEMDPSIKPGG